MDAGAGSDDIGGVGYKVVLDVAVVLPEGGVDVGDGVRPHDPAVAADRLDDCLVDVGNPVLKNIVHIVT